MKSPSLRPKPLIVLLLGLVGLIVSARHFNFPWFQRPAARLPIVSVSPPAELPTLLPSPPAPSPRRIPAQVRSKPDDLPESELVATKMPDSDAEESEGEGRDDWFFEQRAYPLRSIPRAARLRAIRQLEREESRQRELRAESLVGGVEQAEELPAWQSLGPMPIGAGQTFGPSRVPVSGRVSTVVLDPGYNGTTNQTVYLGAAQGGVWRSRDNGATWTPLTDGQPSLAMGAIAIDPTNPNIIYAGTGEGHRSTDSYYGAGLLKSVDGGASWRQIGGPVSTTDPQIPAFVNASFMALAIDPASPLTIYAATNIGSTHGATGGSGVVAIGNRGIWKSVDGGETWRNLNPSNSDVDRTATDVLLDPLNPSRVYAAILSLGIYRSNAGGESGTWEKLAGGLPDTGFARVKLAAGPALPPAASATLYAALAATNNNLLGIYKSTDGGATWSQVIRPQTPGQANYNLALAVDPVDANIVYYGTSANDVNNGGTLWGSRDGGMIWTDLSRGNGTTGGLHADTHAIAISPTNRNILFTANDGGVWRSDNATVDPVAWTSLNQTLSLTQFQSIALHPTDPNIMIGGTQDNGTNLYMGDPTWSLARGGDGGYALIDQSNPQVMYHTFFNRNNSGGGNAQIGPEVSANGGLSWTRRGCFGCMARPGNFNPADRVGFYAPMAQHTGFTSPTDSNVIYFGTHRLYRSADQGVTWTGLGASTDDFGMDLTKGDGRLSAIAAHPMLNGGGPPGEVVWVGTSDGKVQVTINAGALANATFTDVTKPPLPNRFVTDMALDPGDQKRAYVTYSGFNTSTPEAPGHIFVTTDQGQTWADISGNLPDVPVTSIAVDPMIVGALYIGTDIGVFRTTNGGATWLRLANGMPGVATYMLRYHAATRSLVAATHGRGIYRLALPSPAALASVSAASFTGPALASEAIAAAYGSGLATETATATGLPLPTELAGTRVNVRDSAGVDRAAPLFFVSSRQINYQIPPGTTNGLATITVTSGDGGVSSGSQPIDTVVPGLFSANQNGQGVAAAVIFRILSDGSQSFEPIAQFDAQQNQFIAVPVDLGPESDQVFLVLFGTGLRFRSSLPAVTASVGGVGAEVVFVGAAPGFAGLDQVNLRLPRNLTGRGEVEIGLTVDGKMANPVRVSIR